MTQAQYDKYSKVSRQIVVLENFKFKLNDSKRDFPCDVDSNDFYNSVKSLVDSVDKEISNLKSVLENI